MKKRMILFVLAVCTVWYACCGMSSYKGSRYSVGDRVYFGSYEQDNNTRNGAEPIEWFVLDVSGNQVLLISRYVLDAHRFNDSWAEITWDKCSLRTWLNGTFYRTAFSTSERERIATTFVTADRNPYYSSLNPGKDTGDKVFALSVKEAEKYLNKQWLRLSSGTDYARRQGAFISKSNTIDGRGSAWYWLRSPGGYQGRGYMSYAAIMDGSGSISGHEVYNSGYDGSVGGVRPVIWVKLS